MSAELGKLSNYWMTKGNAPVEDLVFPSAYRLVATAQKEVEMGFGFKTEIPKPPVGLFETLKAFAERGITGFDEIYYQPKMQFKKDSAFWDVEGRVRPEEYFWQQIKKGRYPEKVAELEEGWFISDRRGKPMSNNGQQSYGENDYMQPLMAYLRSTPYRVGIEKYSEVPDNSRFGASGAEIDDKILPTFAELSGAKGIVRTRKYMEFNVRGNIAHPEWGKTDTREWFGDCVFRGYSRLIGGKSNDGGLADVGTSSIERRYADAGISPVVFFPSRKQYWVSAPSL